MDENRVPGGHPVALIDWDFAAPGPRAWDVAFAAYRFVPLVSDQAAVGLGVVLPVVRPGRGIWSIESASSRPKGLY